MGVPLSNLLHSQLSGIRKPTMINSAMVFALMMNMCISYGKPVGIVAFGEVGGGKSTLCNTLVGSLDGRAFKESADSEAQAMNTAGNAGKFGS